MSKEFDDCIKKRRITEFERAKELDFNIMLETKDKEISVLKVMNALKKG